MTGFGVRYLNVHALRVGSRTAAGARSATNPAAPVYAIDLNHMLPVGATDEERAMFHERMETFHAAERTRYWPALQGGVVSDLAPVPSQTRHVAHVESDPESFRRGGSTRTAVCSCGWRGPQRATIEVVADDAVEHERRRTG